MAEAGGDGSEIDFTGIDDSTARLTHELHEHIKDQYNSSFSLVESKGEYFNNE